jgi:hypothetical protein
MSGTHWLGGQDGTIAGLDMMAKKKFLFLTETEIQQYY